jgi:hypothetical protein
MACSVIHSDGLTGSWSDCTPLGTHDEVQATAACTASTLGGCHDEVTPLGSAVCGGPAQVVCWVYSGDVDAGGRSGETIEPTPTTIGGAAVDAGQPEGWVTVGDWD